MNKQYLLFDLDGTLTDPYPGISHSILYALDQLRLPHPEEEQLKAFIGPPLWESFQTILNMDEKTADMAVSFYREYFSEKGLFENIPYPGIQETLKALKQKGKTLALATSKPQPFALKIMEHFDLAQYFEIIQGPELRDRSESKAAVIKSVLEKLNNPDKDLCIMIGDRHHDGDGAIASHIDFMGVLYGYGSEEELSTAKILIKKPQEMLQYL